MHVGGGPMGGITRSDMQFHSGSPEHQRRGREGGVPRLIRPKSVGARNGGKIRELNERRNDAN